MIAILPLVPADAPLSTIMEPPYRPLLEEPPDRESDPPTPLPDDPARTPMEPPLRTL